MFTLFALIMLDAGWYLRDASQGPMLFLILLYSGLILWIWKGKSLIFILILYFLNVLFLFVIEYYFLSLTLDYLVGDERIVGIYGVFVLYASILIFLLWHTKKEFVRQKTKAVETDLLKSAFLANMSHEIRTPMNAIIGFSSLLEGEMEKEERSSYIHLIQNSTANLLKLISELIDLSKIEAGDIKLIKGEFSLQEMCADLYDMYTLELKKRGKASVHLTIDVPQDECVIYSDRTRVEQILNNLLSNAIKFTSKGHILLKCMIDDNKLVFLIRDSGTGIPVKDQTLIFNRFTNFNYKGLNTEGSGIGLAIVKKTVEILKGRIWLESELGVGTNFYVELPLVKTDL